MMLFSTCPAQSRHHRGRNRRPFRSHRRQIHHRRRHHHHSHPCGRHHHHPCAPAHTCDIGRRHSNSICSKQAFSGTPSAPARHARCSSASKTLRERQMHKCSCRHCTDALNMSAPALQANTHTHTRPTLFNSPCCAQSKCLHVVVVRWPPVVTSTLTTWLIAAAVTPALPVTGVGCR